MLTKIIGFSLLTYILGNPFLALIILLVILYFLDRRFIGLSPSLTKPLRQIGQLRKLRQQLQLAPHHTAVKLEYARLLIQRKRYLQAAEVLREVLQVMEDSAEVHCELGYCLLKTGEVAEGQRLLEHGLSLNPRVKYGQPYVWLAEATATDHPADAAAQLEKFQMIQSSSCEVCYRLGKLYRQLGDETKSVATFREAVAVYRSLPRYKRKDERRWALLAWLRAAKLLK